jgi:hypothetical protein
MPVDPTDFIRGARNAFLLGLLGWAAIGGAIYKLVG